METQSASKEFMQMVALGEEYITYNAEFRDEEFCNIYRSSISVRTLDVRGSKNIPLMSSDAASTGGWRE